MDISMMSRVFFFILVLQNNKPVHAGLCKKKLRTLFMQVLRNSRLKPVHTIPWNRFLPGLQ